MTEISWGQQGSADRVGSGSSAGPGSKQQRELAVCWGVSHFPLAAGLSVSPELCLNRTWNLSKWLHVVLQLEDKRAEMERQLISVKVQYQSLQKIHAFSKQQMQRLKVACDSSSGRSPVCNWLVVGWQYGCACLVQVQIATLMQLQGSRADPAQLERLQSMLSEKNGEIQNLMTKLQRLEKVEVRT